MAYENRITNRQVDNKSKLVFHFNLGDASNLIRTLHFLENIQIKESTQTNYSEYTPLGNNGSIFTYLGAKSRSIDLDFNITLPHIQTHTLIKPPLASGATKITRNDYFNSMAIVGIEAAREESSKQNIERFINQFIDNVRSEPADLKLHSDPSFSTNDVINASNLLDLFSDSDLSRGYTSGPGAETRLKSLMQVMYWVNLIRSSVLTNSKQPSLGPPIVRLVHGVMYQNVPCIVTDYSMAVDDTAGYDELTFLPRVLKVSMALKEVRQRGETFNNADNQTKDMMPGWEAFAIDGFATLDPMNKVTDTGQRGSI
jgi:hypothetical protein